MRLLTPHRRPTPSPQRGREPGPATTVAPVGVSAALADRLEALSAKVGTFALLPATPIAEEAGAPPLDADVEVAVVAVADDDARGIGMVRALRRAYPRLRLVVSGHGVAWFEDAFDLGADAWVDRAADDQTLLAAIHGPATGPSRGRRRLR